MSPDCIRLVVVAVTLLLSDVTCQTVHNISISHDVRSGRQRRQAHTLTDDVITGIVDRHNALRAYEDAANMELMAWNLSLAREAAAWAAKCKFEHDRGGQNIAGGGDPKDLAPMIDLFHSEKKHYNFDNSKCAAECGHYTRWCGRALATLVVPSIVVLANHPASSWFVTTGLQGTSTTLGHTRRDRRVQSVLMELDGARTNCVTGSVQELERIVCAPRSATTVQS